jgi:hypothetical protein
MSRYLSLILFVLPSSIASASGFVNVEGSRYQINLTKIECIAPESFESVLNPVALAIVEEMEKATCEVFARAGRSYNCSAIDRAFAARLILLKALRENGHCSCETGPAACATVCENYLSEKDCSLVCLGNCNPPFPAK